MIKKKYGKWMIHFINILLKTLFLLEIVIVWKTHYHIISNVKIESTNELKKLILKIKHITTLININYL